MEKIQKKCPQCGSEEKQRKMGFNRSKTQRMSCKICGKTYTINPKKHAYSAKERQEAIKMFYSGASGRQVGAFYGMNKSNVYNWIKKNDAEK